MSDDKLNVKDVTGMAIRYRTIQDYYSIIFTIGVILLIGYIYIRGV